MLSSADVLGNLQYFKSEKAENVRNLNYLERSVHTALFFTHGNPVAFTPQTTIASEPVSKKGHRFSRAIGSTVDGVAHVTSRVKVCSSLRSSFPAEWRQDYRRCFTTTNFRSRDERVSIATVSSVSLAVRFLELPSHRFGFGIASGGSGPVERCEGDRNAAHPRHQIEGISWTLHGINRYQCQP